MGPCFSKKALIDGTISHEFRKDHLQNGIRIPIRTTLYNMLRKPRQLEIIRGGGGEKILNGQTDPDLTKIKTNDLKMLYNFKNILAIDSIAQSLEILNQAVNLKAVYQITRSEAQQFVREYPIFKYNQNKSLKTAAIPLLVFHSDELVNQDGRVKKQIFVHSKKYKNDKIYQTLRIQQIIEDTNSEEGNKEELIVKQLKNSKKERVLFLHSNQITQTDILNILSEYVHKQYNTSMINTKMYIQKFLPNTNIASEIDQMMAVSMVEAQKEKEELTMQEKFHKYFKKLSKEGNKDKTERAYHLLITLISNIYSNRDSENYRRVKKTNKQMNELLGRYKYGLKILQMIGFHEEGEHFVNEVQSKYLKLYRTDMDVGYRKYIDEQ